MKIEYKIAFHFFTRVCNKTAIDVIPSGNSCAITAKVVINPSSLETSNPAPITTPSINECIPSPKAAVFPTICSLS